MKIKMIRSFYSILFVLITFTLLSQEGLKPLGSNINYIFKDLKPRTSLRDIDNVSQQKSTAVATNTLPFIEDFSYSPTSNYPDQNKWEDSAVYVNSGMAIAPLSIGVATFDGLNKHGYPYNPTLINLALSSPADVLTSKPINLYTVGQQTLDPFSGVALSFYYQARGRGDNPEVSDSLILDFFSPKARPDTAWKSVWFKTGNTSSNTNDTAFKRAFVRIKDTAYFHDGFKFRFRNYASVTGNFDHWHIDYIFLDQGRGDSLFDTVRNDITFAGMPTPFLKDYSEMPYQQYNKNEMASNLNNRIRNNGAAQVNMSYKYRITDDTQTLTFPEYDGGFANLNPFWKNTFTPLGNGYSIWQPHAKPNIKDSFLLPPPKRINYEIKHFVFLNQGSSGTDVIRQNDTVVQYQFFRDFYAFDDGSAEAGYYVNAVGAKIAVKLRTNITDTLRALRIYFDPVGNVSSISNTLTSVHKFKMYVWSLGVNGAPGSIIYTDSVEHVPAYIKTGFKEIPEFKFKNPLVLGPGTYFVGIQQAASNITIGFDKNYNHQTNLYYDAGSGWTQSAENGSIMIRALFTNKIPEIASVGEYGIYKRNKYLVYPNPSSDQFTIFSSKTENASYQLFNSTGQLVKEETLENTEHIVSTLSLNTGVYVLILRQQGAVVQQQKIIILR